MYRNGCINEYGCAMDLKHTATDYEHQVFNYNNKKNHKSYLKNSAATFVWQIGSEIL
jgi:hypothetical protein